jgi:hypothetical protein
MLSKRYLVVDACQISALILNAIGGESLQ